MNSDDARRRGWIASAAALAPFLLLTWRFDFLCDDAFISFRYARNLAEGLGLRYNPGASPPVEGYSELLWVLLLGGGTKLGITPLVLSRVLSIGAGVWLLRTSARLLAERAAPSTLAAAGAALFLGCAPPLAVWATGGMATMPFAALVVALFAALWLGERPAATWKLGALGAALVLVRADGAWWVLWLLGPALVAGLVARDRERWLPALLGALVSILVLGAQILWRWSTYGDWLPNTARAKVGLSVAALERGGEYLGHALLTFPGIALAALAGVLVLRREARTLAALLVLLATLAHAVLAGGDFMAFARFVVPALPFAALLLGAGLERLEGRFGVGAALVGAGLCVATVLPPAFGGAVTPLPWRAATSVRSNFPGARERGELEQWRMMSSQTEEWSDLGRALALVSEPGDSIAYAAVGAIGYYSNLFVFDRCGLVTREVAMLPAPEVLGSPGHDKLVPAEFFADRLPTYLDAFWYPGTEAQLRRDPRTGGGGRALEVSPLEPARSPRPDQLLVVRRGDR